jgi:GNAT superfamily N-acetyltransferase
MTELRPFHDDDLDAAGWLLAARHRRHRLQEPLLPERYEHAHDARAAVESAWRKPGATGVVAERDGRVVGYLIGAPRDEGSWGANEWIEVDGRIVGFLEACAVELSGEGVDGHATLARPDGACFLAFAATDPEARGLGTGVELTSAALAWAHRAGYSTMVTDWRVPNLLGSRFWPRRGFRTTFLRLYRSIP